MNRHSLINDYDLFRRSLLGEDAENAIPGAVPPLAPPASPVATPQAAVPTSSFEPGEPERLEAGESVDVPADIVDAPPEATPAAAPQSDLMQLARMLAAQRDLDAHTVQSDPDKNLSMPREKSDRISEAMYSAFTRQPLKDDFFKRADPMAALAGQKGMTPLDLMKFQETVQQHQFNQWLQRNLLGLRENKDTRDTVGQTHTFTQDDIKNSEWGQDFERKTRKDAEDAMMAREKLESEKADREQSRRLAEMRIALESTNQDRLGRQSSSAALSSYVQAVKDDIAPVTALVDVEQLAPGLTHGQITDPKVRTRLGTINRLSKAVSNNKGILNFGELLKEIGSEILKDPSLSEAERTETDKLLSAIKRTHYLFGAMIAGKNFTGDEMKQLAEGLASGVFSTPEALAAGLDAIRHHTGQKIRNQEAGYNQAVPEQMWTQFVRDGGYTTRMPLFSDIKFQGTSPQVQGRQPTESEAIHEDVRDQAIGMAHQPLPSELKREVTPEQVQTLQGSRPVEVIAGLGKPTVEEPSAAKQEEVANMPTQPRRKHGTKSEGSVKVKRLSDGQVTDVPADDAKKLLAHPDRFIQVK